MNNAEYKFNYDWAFEFRKNAELLFSSYKNIATSYLEIGIYEGRSACWMLDNILLHHDSFLTGVDIKVRDQGWENLSRHVKYEIIEGDSKIILPRLSGQYDIIYIDGDHSAKGTLCDSVNSWLLCKKDGIILWDDKMQNHPTNGVPIAISSFLNCLAKEDYKVLIDGYQFAVKKLRN